MQSIYWRLWSKDFKGYLVSFVFLACLVWAVLGVAYAQSDESQNSDVPLIVPESVDARASSSLSDDSVSGDVGGDVIERIIVEGARRIDPKTIVGYLDFSAGDIYSVELADLAVKGLYASGLFSNVVIVRLGGDVIVRVQENPVINRLSFEGNERIDDAILSAEVGLTARSVYSRGKVQSATQRILDIYRRRGRYAVRVEPQIIQREQNRIDLVFEITEGQLSTIKRIFFNGNRFFSDSDLKNEISSQEYSWYNFLTSSDTYDPDRVDYDKELLRRHYLRFGFIDYRLASSVGELLEDRSGFYITFALEEGVRYRLGEFSSTSAIAEVTADMVTERIDLDSGDWYDQNVIDRVRDEITDYLGDLGYAFADIDVSLHRRSEENGVVDLSFDVKESQRVFVERIDISGNVRTVDKVIRREFELVEGDPYNRSKVRLSEYRLQRLGYFSKVAVRERAGSSSDRTRLEVEVEEKSTGAINLGVGYSTLDGGLFSVKISETNVLGRAHEVHLAYIRSKRKETFTANYARPYFLGYNLKAGVQVFNVVDEEQESRYETTDTGFALTGDYPLADYLTQRVVYRFSDQELLRNNSAGAVLSTSDSILSSVSQVLLYDRRNSSFQPTAGYYVRLSNDLSGVGGDVHYLRTGLRGAYYQNIGYSEWNMLVGGELGYIIGWDGENVRQSDRYILGGSNLRGFQPAGAGPRSSPGGFALGGTTLATVTAELRRPLFDEEFRITGALFSDVGLLIGTEDDDQIYFTRTSEIVDGKSVVHRRTSIVDDEEIRASAGAGISVITPIGPMRFDFAWPIKKQSYDRDRVFQFSFRGRF